MVLTPSDKEKSKLEPWCFSCPSFSQTHTAPTLCVLIASHVEGP